MPISAYLRGLRDRVGHSLLLVPVVAAVVRDEQGRILVERRADDRSWTLPAGIVDPGEEPAKALVREVWEETGLRVRPVRVAGVFGGGTFRHTYPNGDQVEPTILLFDCETLGGRLRTQDGEALELCYFSPEELPPLVMPFPPDLFGRALSGPNAQFAWDDAWLDTLTD